MSKINKDILVLKLVGGVFDGEIHEIYAGWFSPDSLALPHFDGYRYWYKNNYDGTASFMNKKEKVEV